jgi:excisionase family DNA binding protein
VTISTAQPGYSARSTPVASLEREQLEALAELIASRLRHARANPAPDERKQFVTARQAAELLAVDLKTVYRHAKELGGLKVGGTWRFDLDAATKDDGAGFSDRYASESPQPSERPVDWGGNRARKRTRDRVDCQLLPVGRVTDRQTGSS